MSENIHVIKILFFDFSGSDYLKFFLSLQMLLGLISYSSLRKCEDMRFCRDNLLVNNTNGWELSSPSFANKDFSAKLVYNQVVLNHTLHINKITNSGFHLYVDLDEKLTSYRYDFYHDDLIVNKTRIDTLDELNHTSANGVNYLNWNNFTVKIESSPLRITFMRNGVEYIDISSQNFMIIENGEDVDTELFDGKLETVPNGATSVGLSFSFDNKSLITGFLEEDTTLNLEDIESSRRYTRDGYSLYGSVPFFYAHHQSLNYTPSVFWMNPTDTFFNLRHENNQRTIRLLSEGGFINTIIFIDHMSEVLKEYTYLTGLPEFPPAWTLGYQQSKWGYESQKVVEEVLSNLSINGIPHDVTWLDIDHLNASTPLTMSNEWFYDSKKMFDDAERENGIIIRIADPHMKVDNDFKPYNECAEQDFFVKYQSSNFVSECWPGLSSWPDYLRKEVRS